ncbi:helix-turn-helix domain-containing protein [Ralstonia solanacearum]|uniref:helix-turn-helix domain-containing protein n=1 Tax=Ralstonia solanacearum TaxID=305 RepID=UPI0001D95235|nr:helix-turn-helix domain-containing protein [Ralstonia solanacearum]CBJ43113.1 conserved protein of unknown function [Ralstonia solanacearum CFBP2957]
MRIEKYLDQVVERRGLKNDTALAELLGVGQSAVSHYRTGRRTADNEVCLRLAQLLDMENPMPIIMAADMDRAERAGQRSLWEVFSPRMAHSGLAAILVALGLGVTNFVTPSPAEAAPLSHSQARPMFIMLNIVSAENARFAATEPFPPHLHIVKPNSS